MRTSPLCSFPGYHKRNGNAFFPHTERHEHTCNRAFPYPHCRPADAEALYSYEGTYQMHNLIVGKAITGLSTFV